MNPDDAQASAPVAPPPQPAAELDLRQEPNIITETLKLDTSAVAKTTSTDIARIGLSIFLVGILAVVVIVSVFAVSANGKNEAAIEALLKVILSPIIGLVGSVVGFYFGAKASGGSSPPNG
jgi:hypothetical protein